MKEAREKIGEAATVAKEKFDELSKQFEENETVKEAREKMGEVADVVEKKAQELSADAAEMAGKVADEVKKSGFFQKLKSLFGVK